MKIPFYQTEWLGIDLLEVAYKTGHAVSQVAGSKFYNEIYQNLLRKDNFLLNQSCLDEKLNLSQWVYSFLIHSVPEEATILSVGCGLGVFECPLIQKGLRVDLQECQPYSIQYLEKNHPDILKKTSFILSEDLSNIPSNSYDVVMSITSTYCLTTETLLDFLDSVKRILKNDGIFIWYETILRLEDIIQYIKSLIYNTLVNNENHQKMILWGWKRSLPSQSLLAQLKGLKLFQTAYFDRHNSEMIAAKRMGLPYGDSLSWQMGIYRS